MSATAPAPFGSGGAEPWSAVLRGALVSLALVPTDPTARAELLDVRRWTAAADRADRRALRGLTGPLLDIGCGPGRMVRAAIAKGLDASGLDVDPDAGRAAHLPVLHGSVFDPLPLEGRWGALLLLDGNIGIGGDVPALLARCRALLRRGGLLVVEVDADPDRDERTECLVRDSDGGESDVFPWSRIGATALVDAARGFSVDRRWQLDGRSFVRLRAR